LPATARLQEITMRNVILTMLIVPLIAALTAQRAVASEHHHTRTNDRTVAIKQIRNSNAYAAPSYIAVQPGWSSLDEGAMTSGIAGH
jgi:hypothetical protein